MQDSNRPYVIGLTGGIGSGKSTVADLFAKLDVDIIDADIIARDIVGPEAPTLVLIKQHFGDDIITEDGNLNRTKLREVIFENPDAKIWLENLLHPMIRHEIQNSINDVKKPYCIVVIPLLIENEITCLVDRILVVDTTMDLQIQRASSRDQTSPHDIEKILAAQASRSERLICADDVIENMGAITELTTQVASLHKNYLKLTGLTN